MPLLLRQPDVEVCEVATIDPETGRLVMSQYVDGRLINYRAIPCGPTVEYPLVECVKHAAD